VKGKGDVENAHRIERSISKNNFSVKIFRRLRGGKIWSGRLAALVPKIFVTIILE
jgi:hypothetical protein